MLAIVIICASLTELSISQNLQNEDNRIVGGQKVQEHIPYQVSLQLKLNKPKENTWVHICGGSIIETNFVLTAAHCVRRYSINRFSVLAGTLKRNENGSRHLVEKIFIHPNNGNALTKDIALLKMAEPFVYSKTINKINLNKDEIDGGVVCKLSGWGHMHPHREGNLPLELHTISLKTISLKECLNRGMPVTNTEICTFKGKGQGACVGDSGGPLVNENRTSQIGIVSYGTQVCASGRPDVFSRISSFVPWIMEKIHNEDTLEVIPPKSSKK